MSDYYFPFDDDDPPDRFRDAFREDRYIRGVKQRRGKARARTLGYLILMLLLVFAGLFFIGYALQDDVVEVGEWIFGLILVYCLIRAFGAFDRWSDPDSQLTNDLARR